MKHYLAKISSIFFLTVLLASNIVSLHIYFHEQNEKLSHNQNEDHEEEVPCDTCVLAFNLNNLDYNNSLEFSFESLTQVQQIPQQKKLVYVETLHEQLCTNSNRNKAPPYLV